MNVLYYPAISNSYFGTNSRGNLWMGCGMWLCPPPLHIIDGIILVWTTSIHHNLVCHGGKSCGGIINISRSETIPCFCHFCDHRQCKCTSAHTQTNYIKPMQHATVWSTTLLLIYSIQIQNSVCWLLAMLSSGMTDRGSCTHSFSIKLVVHYRLLAKCYSGKSSM